MPGYLCHRHRNGVSLSTPRFFCAGCPQCEAKAAKDPSLRDIPPETGPAKLRRGEKWVDHTKLRRQWEARQRYYREHFAHNKGSGA